LEKRKDEKRKTIKNEYDYVAQVEEGMMTFLAGANDF